MEERAEMTLQINKTSNETSTAEFTPHKRQVHQARSERDGTSDH